MNRDCSCACECGCVCDVHGGWEFAPAAVTPVRPVNPPKHIRYYPVCVEVYFRSAA